MKRYFLSMMGCVLCATLCLGQGGAANPDLAAAAKAEAGADTSVDHGAGAQAARTPWKFRSSGSIGMAAGQIGGYGLVEIVNGLYKGPWFLGLGTGLDYYRYRSVPLFLSVTRDLLGAPKIGKLYVVAGGGINIPWYDREPLPYGVQSSKFYPGWWWNAGLGYRARLSQRNDNAVLFSMTYGFKELSEKQKGSSICPTCFILEVQNPPTTDYEYLNRELLISVGFQF